MREERPRYALLYAAIAYMAGTAVGSLVSFHYAFIILELLLLGVCFVLLAGRRRFVYVPLFLLLALTGMTRCSLALRHIETPQPGTVTVEARIEQKLKYDEEKGRATYRMTDVRVTRNGATQRTKAKAYASLPCTERLAPRAGQTVRFEGFVYEAQEQRNPGGFDFYRYLRGRGMDFGLYGTRVIDISDTGVFQPLALLDAARGVIAARIDALYGARAGMMQGLLLGDKSGLAQDLYDAFKKSGIAHLLAVSGLHVGLLAFLLAKLFDWFSLSIRFRLVLTSALLVGYCLLIGAPASAVRACVMSLLLLAARASGRDYNAPTAMAAAALLILTFEPLALLDMGFVLSFTTVLGIVLLHPRVEGALGFLPERMRGSLSIAVAAQAASLPAQAMFFGEIPLLGIPANLLCIFLAGFAVPAGLLSLLLSAIYMPLGRALAWLVGDCLRGMEVLSRFFASFPLGSLRIPRIPLLVAAACILCFFLLSPYVHMRKFVRFISCFSVFSLALCLWLFPKGLDVRYIQLDVGQGDAAVLLTKDFTLAIDTGPSEGEALRDFLRKEGRCVDLLLLSHLDTDHAGGLSGLLDAGIPIARIGLPTGIEAAETDADVLDALSRAVSRGASLEGYAQGDVVKTPPELQVDVLCPTPSAEGANGRCLMLRIDVNGVTILTAGDVPVQNEVHVGTDCDILKLSHHGAKNGTSIELLRHAAPSLALISVGENTYGHPSEEVMSRLREAGIPALRTDECGAIEIRIQNGGYSVRRFVQDRGVFYDASGIF